MSSRVEPFRHVRAFLTDEEVQRWRAHVARRADLFHAVEGKGGLGPRYRVIDGDQIAAELPEIAALGDQRVRPLAADFAGHPVAPLASSKRAIRVQSYARRDHGFRWHFDGHPYVALVALENGNAGETHFMSLAWSRVLRWLLYPLYPFPQVLSIFPYQRVAMAPGDLLVMRGARILHRGVTRRDDGERLLLTYTFDHPGRRANPLRDWIARRLNY